MTLTPKPAKTPKLKPCPTCGSGDISIFVGGFGGNVRYAVGCLICGAQTFAGSQEAAIAKWEALGSAPLDPRPTVTDD